MRRRFLPYIFFQSEKFISPTFGKNGGFCLAVSGLFNTFASKTEIPINKDMMNTNNTHKKARRLVRTLTAAAIMAMTVNMSTQAQETDTTATFRTWALTPPMGWNSWDCYYSSVNEKLTMQNAQYIVDHGLDKYGWEYVVVDIRWYCNHPSLGGGYYNQQGTQDYVLDEYGRYLPSPTRFPSAMVNGKNRGFKAMADSLHNMGLKFGIHIMRGVPKSVIGSSYKLKGAEDVAWNKVYASTTPPCTWLKDNLLVQDNEYGQLYYNSIIDLYAEWGVDFIKVDDISRPFHTEEIRMLRKAIDRCGRPIVLSLSPGKTQYKYAEDCLENANMWRMMDDLWDSWSSVDLVFNEAHEWSKYYRPGNYADCDMLPLGQIAMTVADPGYTGAQSGRWTRLTQDEQYSLMTLWGICHSPLFFGGEMTRNDDFTNSLLTNEEYLHMHHYGVDAHQVINDENNGQTVWTSTDPMTGNRYLALFNRGNTRWVVGNKALYQSEVVAYTTDGHKVDVDIEWPEGSKTLVLVVDDGGDNYNYDHGDWISPTLVLRDGSKVQLTGKYMTRTYTNSYYNRVFENKNVQTEGKMKVMGKTYLRGFSTDANAAIFFTIPDDMDVVRFTATAAADDSGINQTGATTSIRFMVFDQNPITSEQEDAKTLTTADISVDLTQFGYAADEAVPVYDIWEKQTAGSAKGTFTAKVPSHGAKLYRLGDNKETDIKSITKDEARALAKAEGLTAVYDVNGNRTDCDFDSLQPGIYIFKGNKYLIR